MATTVELGAEVRVSGSRNLVSDVIAFELSGVPRASASYDVSPDGERLLLITGTGTGVTLDSAEGSVVVLNVFEELNQRWVGADAPLLSARTPRFAYRVGFAVSHSRVIGCAELASR